MVNSIVHFKCLRSTRSLWGDFFIKPSSHTINLAFVRQMLVKPAPECNLLTLYLWINDALSLYHSWAEASTGTTNTPPDPWNSYFILFNNKTWCLNGLKKCILLNYTYIAAFNITCVFSFFSAYASYMCDCADGAERWWGEDFRLKMKGLSQTTELTGTMWSSGPHTTIEVRSTVTA